MAKRDVKTKQSSVGPSAGTIRRLIGKAWLKAFGWEATGEKPDVPSAIFVANPHTSGWDLPFTLAVGWALDMKISWAGKNVLFRGPLGPVMRALGGVPIDRSKRANQVQRIAETIKREGEVYLVIAPAGTRARRDHWKSGFYHIAREANVPLLLAYLDYTRKRGGVGEVFWPTGNIRGDMDEIREFYRGIEGKHPERHSAPVLKEELVIPTMPVALG